jgi:formylglycine-generating enzyme required for sulfatase activity
VVNLSLIPGTAPSRRRRRAVGTASLIAAAMLACHGTGDEPPKMTDVGEPETGPARWTNAIGMTFVAIPAGSFVMGSSSTEAEGHERPAHTVTISRSFELTETEVTQGQWTSLMGTNPARFQGDRLPIEQVSWIDVQEFIRRLNAGEGTHRYRLPTEAEWEYACLAGADEIPDGERYRLAWYAANGGGATHPVGLKAANAWGLYDMLGNVYEWCGDAKSDYPSGSVADPRGPTVGFGRVVRGGSWMVHANRVTPRFRDHLAPDERRDDVGFRVVAVRER